MHESYVFGKFNLLVLGSRRCEKNSIFNSFLIMHVNTYLTNYKKCYLNNFH